MEVFVAAMFRHLLEAPQWRSVTASPAQCRQYQRC